MDGALDLGGNLGSVTGGDSGTTVSGVSSGLCGGCLGGLAGDTDSSERQTSETALYSKW